MQIALGRHISPITGACSQAPEEHLSGISLATRGCLRLVLYISFDDIITSGVLMANAADVIDLLGVVTVVHGCSLIRVETDIHIRIYLESRCIMIPLQNMYLYIYMTVQFKYGM